MSALLSKLDQLPPWACRLLARHNRKPLTSHEIAKRAGITPSWVNKLSKRLTWANVTIASYDAFVCGTGVDPLCRKRQTQFLRRTKNAEHGGMAHTHNPTNAYYYRRLLAQVENQKNT